MTVLSSAGFVARSVRESQGHLSSLTPCQQSKLLVKLCSLSYGPSSMFGWNKPKKDHGLYYLLPGMNSGNRRRRKQWQRFAVIFAIVVSALIGLILWMMNK